MSHPPAFQFYASDYLSSSKVQKMSLEEEGAYIRLLAYSWQDGSIPDDEISLARLCKTNRRKMRLIWENLQDCFKPHPSLPHRLVNDRLEKVREIQAAYRENKIRAGHVGGIKSGESKRSKREAKAKQNGSTTTVLLKADTIAKQSSPVSNLLSSINPSPIHNSNTEISSVPIEQNANERTGKNQMDFQKFWKPVEGHIRQNIVDETFQKYYAGCTIVSFKHDAVTLAVPDSLIEYETSKDQAQMRLAAMIEESQTGLLRGRKLVIKTIGEVVSKALTS